MLLPVSVSLGIGSRKMVRCVVLESFGRFSRDQQVGWLIDLGADFATDDLTHGKELEASTSPVNICTRTFLSLLDPPSNLSV